MDRLTAGVDEAGRGPLAGPVVAAAVILDDMRRIKGLADSKVLTPAKRERLFDEIRAHALAFCVAEASVDEIDTLNILHATMLAMKRAVEGLRLPDARASTVQYHPEAGPGPHDALHLFDRFLAELAR